MLFRLIETIFFISQIFWAWQIYKWAHRSIRNTTARRLLAAAVLAVYFVMFAYTFGWIDTGPTPTSLTLREALISAPLLWWIAGSVFGFLVAILIAPFRWLGRLVPQRIVSPSRRVFLSRSAALVTGAPFVAGAYGMFYGRLNLEITTPRLRLPRAPKAFRGFRIAQLSDIHIGPFMTAEQIRKFVAITNARRPHLIVLTGDFVTFDPETRQAAVAALSGLRAPFGVYGCLGNHDAWTGVEDSITALFADAHIRILRQEAVAIEQAGESFQLIGVDFQTRRRFGPSHTVPQFLDGVDKLMAPGRLNILLSHNPDTFDRAAELGVDLSLAGHTHGGQAALEFISPELAPSRLVTPYVAGLFQKPGGQLYVNRGIGTIAVPIRIGAPPEISVFEI